MVLQAPSVLFADFPARHPVLTDLQDLPDEVDRVLDHISRIVFKDLVKGPVHQFIGLIVDKPEALKNLFGLYQFAVIELAALMEPFSNLDIVLEAFSVKDMLGKYIYK